MNGKLFAIAAAAAAMTICAPADAADIYARPSFAKEPLPLLYNWTGFYVGAHFGGSFGEETESLAGGTFSTNPSGVMGGVQLGYNNQFAPNWLWGIEGELSWTSATGSVGFTAGGAAVALNSNHNWYDTLAGRFGYTQNNWLFYGKLGPAWMNADYAVAAGAGATSFNATRAGWTIGAGAEYSFNPAWSAKIEYAFLDFGTSNYAYAIAGGVPVGIDTQVHEVKVGLNYHFIPGMPVWPGSPFGR